MNLFDFGGHKGQRKGFKAQKFTDRGKPGKNVQTEKP